MTRPTPIDARALLSDTRSATLLTPDGELDWWCAPRFDSAPALDRLLDPEGTSFSLRARDAGPAEFGYVEDTLATRTVWRSPRGELVVYDWMPYPTEGAASILRMARCVRGECSLDVRLRARERLHLESTRALADPERAVVELVEGDVVAFRLAQEPSAEPLTVESAAADLASTSAAWRAWIARARPTPGPRVARSLLTLKALTYAPTGAIVAAATTSLPEVIGGERNWDYRYAWVRDSALCAAALRAWGLDEDARRLGEWIIQTVQRHPDAHHALYAVDGDHAPDETIAQLAGYAESRPVRFGNGAVNQVQHDAYGHAIECLHYCGALEAGEHGFHWEIVEHLADCAARDWRKPDNSIWEVPAGPRGFTYSRMLCWFALHHAVSLAEEHDLPGDLALWARERDAIRSHLIELARANGGSLPQSEEAPSADAANLRASLIGFLPGDHDVMRETIRRIRHELEPQLGIVRRYATPDGLSGKEGAFLACGFWLAEALEAAGDPVEAQRVFAAVEATAGPLGLFAEERDLANDQSLGNYPQAIVHAAHAAAAARSDERIEREAGIATRRP